MAYILVIDDEPKMTSLICGTLEDEGHKVETCTDPEKGLKLIAEHSFDVVITDLNMPKVNGMAVLKAALERGAEVVMMTAYATAETAVEALKSGAADYLIKPFSLDELAILVNKLNRQKKTEALAEHYEAESQQHLKSELIGKSPASDRVRQLIKQVAVTESTVLLTGKSGTGKELAARMIHDRSPRREHPFIAINCAAIPESLLESELFGHEKGAFTGAHGRKKGRFELADRGSIFLDEIGEMPPPMQAKLLRVLEEREVVRVGGVDSLSIDVRVIAATNQNLKVAVQDGTFREDLYFRLNVFPIELPPLTERGEDVILLAEFFLKKAGYANPVLNDEVRDTMLRYDWPGNVRELRNVLERGTILAAGEPLTLDDLSLDVEGVPLRPSSVSPDVEQGLENAEKEMLLNALEQAGGNKTEAARLLKISRRRLYSRMKVHGIKP